MNNNMLKFTIIIIAAVLWSAGLQILQADNYSRDATGIPFVETAVAGTLTAVAPTTNAIQPTDLPTKTLTPTSTATANLDEIIALTVTASFVEATSLKAWVETPNGNAHAYHNLLPKVIRAVSKDTADLIVTIQVQQESQAPLKVTGGCGGSVARVKRNFKIIVKVVKTGDTLPPIVLAGGSPGRPFMLSSCDTLYGNEPNFTAFFNWLAKQTYLVNPPTLTPSPIPTLTPIP